MLAVTWEMQTMMSKDPLFGIKNYCNKRQQNYKSLVSDLGSYRLTYDYILLGDVFYAI